MMDLELRLELQESRYQARSFKADAYRVEFG